MTALGIGVRVRVGWCPADRMKGSNDPRLRTGTITDGPVGPGGYVSTSGALYVFEHRYWEVALDGAPRALVAEQMLTPIDDDDPGAVHEDEREEISA